MERNALRAGLVGWAEAWRRGSLWRRQSEAEKEKSLLHPGSLPLPDDWVERVNRPQTETELEAVRQAVLRGWPFGSVG